MKQILLTIISSAFYLTAISQDISGSWKGEVDLNGIGLEIGFSIEKVGSGYSASMDIPQQGMSGAKVSSTSFVDSVLTMNLIEYDISYEGKLNEFNQFDGQLSQASSALPLTLMKGEIILNRPQEPKAPFEYKVENIEFPNKSAGLKLAGTLSIPKGKGKFPVAIIVSGSGPQDLDGSMFGHKPYLLLADELTKNGVAVFRYDERGVGGSEGVFENATTDDFISDVEAAIDYLQSRKDLNSKKIGLIGHSLGGIIAPRVAVENKNTAFVVLMAAPGVPGDQLMLSQKAAMERLMGIDEGQIAQGQEFLKGIYDIIANSKADRAGINLEVQNYFTKNYGAFIPPEQAKQITDQITTNEVIGLLQTNPETYLSKLSCPVLAINGNKDFQVAAAANLAAIKAALESGGNKSATIIEFEGVNHLFQTCDTGALSEYSMIEETMAPEVLDTVTGWVLEKLKIEN